MAAVSAPEEATSRDRTPTRGRLRPLRSLLTDLRRRIERRAVLVIALFAVLFRLPYLAVDGGQDESGYLMIGAQWHSAGSSLYQNYWVDRPPLLITIFGVAAKLGGLVPLRMIGCLATVLVVLGTAYLARRLGGQRAAGWAALTAAALCATPLLGGQQVNGELLSAPFVVAGLIAFVIALDHLGERRAMVTAGLGGAAFMASLLVKQNMADVAVFALVALLLAWRRTEITTPRLLRSILGATAGALACLGMVALWTMAHGTSVVGVFDAMYPFRVQAGRVMAASNRSAADARLWELVVRWARSGGAAIMVLTAVALFARRLRSTAVWALVAVVVFDVVSVVLGGSYWGHYLIQLVVPIAVLSGLLVAGHLPGARLLPVLAAAATVIVLGINLSRGIHTPTGVSLGQAVREVAKPHDTIVTVWGHTEVTGASGLSSPYPYLWSLPARTLDPNLTDLTTLLEGPRAPTWFVSWNALHTWNFNSRGPVAAQVLREHYTPVARFHDHTIYLYRGVQRAVPQLSSLRQGHRSASADGALLTSDRPAKELP